MHAGRNEYRTILPSADVAVLREDAAGFDSSRNWVPYRYQPPVVMLSAAQDKNLSLRYTHYKIKTADFQSPPLIFDYIVKTAEISGIVITDRTVVTRIFLEMIFVSTPHWVAIISTIEPTGIAAESTAIPV